MAFAYFAYKMSMELCHNDKCSKLLLKPLNCAKCKDVIYCSKGCQIEDWNAGHKIECKLKILQNKRSWESVLAFENKELIRLRAMRDECTRIASNVYYILGDCHYEMERFNEALELWEQWKKICEARKDVVGVARAHCAMGLCHENMCNYQRSLALYCDAKAIFEELGNDRGMALVYGNIGNYHLNMGNFASAKIELENSKLLYEGLGDTARMGAVYSKLGQWYSSTGDFDQAMKLYREDLKICRDTGNYVGAIQVCANMGKCDLNSGNIARAVSFFKQYHRMAKNVNIGCFTRDATYSIGVALRIKVRNTRCDDEAREAEEWLQNAKDLGHKTASLQLARLAFDAHQSDKAISHLKDFMSLFMQLGPNQCSGCHQMREHDVSMLMCGGCRVAKFCNVEHQKMASKRVSSGRMLLNIRHKEVCGLLGKWKKVVVNGGNSPETLHDEFLAFLLKVEK